MSEGMQLLLVMSSIILFVIVYNLVVYYNHKKFIERTNVEILSYEPKKNNKHIIKVKFRLNINGERKEYYYGINVYRIIRNDSSWYDENPAEFVIFAEMTERERKESIKKALTNYDFLLRILMKIEKSDIEDKADEYWDKMLKED